jgi:ligand-binding sensor domain-containing protein/AraC-like DNA-binding protein
MDQGLLHNYVDDIYKDGQGFLWIATEGGGLSRYDGYEFTHYNTNTPQVRLRSNFIRNVCEDGFGRLWISSEGGIEILSLSSRRLTLPSDATGRLAGVTDQPSVAVMRDSKGCMWAFSGTTLHKICFDGQGNVSKIFSLPPIHLSMPAAALRDVDGDGNIWVGLKNTVCKLFEGDAGALEATPVAPCLQLEEGIFISDFLQDGDDVWVGTDRGLIRYGKSQKAIKKHYTHEPQQPRSLSQNHVTGLALAQNRQLMVSTLMGINLYNPGGDDFERITQDNAPAGGSLCSNFVNCMLADGDVVWLGTETGGVNKITRQKLSIRSYVHSGSNPGSLSPNPVNAIYEDARGSLWVGTVEGGLNRKAAGSESFTHYTSGSPSRLSHNSVSAITADGEERLWVGTWGGGVSLLDLRRPEQPALTHITPQTRAGFPASFIGSLCYDAINNGMWIGSNSGVFFYECATGRLISPFANRAAEEIRGAIGAVVDRQGRLWMGCLEGVYVVDLRSRSADTFRYQHLRYKLDDPASKQIEKICCFCLASDGTLWMGSNGYGIYKLAPDEKGCDRFTSYTTNDGLINNNIRGMLEDDSGCLWISTNNGLSCFNPATGRFDSYAKDDGLPGSQFYWNAYCRSRSGLLYFGGLGGLVAVNADRCTPQSTSAKVTLTKLRVAYREILPGSGYVDADVALARTLRLHERDKSFSLEFSALDYTPQATAAYRYRLKGFDDQWVETPATRRFASYTNLPPGRYTFQVQYIPTKAAAKSAPVTELEVIVAPFFYKTGWFIFAALALTACGAACFHRRHIYALKRQKEALRQMVEERTRELRQQTLILENQTKELEIRNSTLTQQNEEITRQKRQLITMSRKVEELTEALQMEEEPMDKKFVNKALEVIKENYKNPTYEVGDFIAAMGVSKSLLNKKMQRLIGQSAGQLIRSYRLNVAHELIVRNRETKSMNISEIAYEVGFNDPKYFTRCFTKRFNTSPSSLLGISE